jgi:hypothetical protein
VATYDCRYCNGPLERSATECPACGEAIGWPWLRPSKRWIRGIGRMPDAEFRDYCRSLVLLLHQAQVILGIAISVASFLGAVDMRGERPPDSLRRELATMLYDERTSEMVTEKFLEGYDFYLSVRQGVESGFWLLSLLGLAWALSEIQTIRMYRRLLEPPPPAGPIGGPFGTAPPRLPPR